jgi:hypothetical protein
MTTNPPQKWSLIGKQGQEPDNDDPADGPNGFIEVDGQPMPNRGNELAVDYNEGVPSDAAFAETDEDGPVLSRPASVTSQIHVASLELNNPALLDDETTPAKTKRGSWGWGKSDKKDKSASKRGSKKGDILLPCV